MFEVGGVDEFHLATKVALPEDEEGRPRACRMGRRDLGQRRHEGWVQEVFVENEEGARVEEKDSGVPDEGRKRLKQLAYHCDDTTYTFHESMLPYFVRAQE